MAIKANGKILREFNGVTYLPFGSEYSILLKNLSTRRCRVSVHIDGSDALDNANLIIEAGSETNLTRFIKAGNLEVGNSFKFIEKSDKVEKFRGNKVDDGLVTVHFEFEQEAPKQVLPNYTTRVYSTNTYQTMGYDTVTRSGFSQPMAAAASAETTYTAEVKLSSGNILRSKSLGFAAAPQNSAGVTAPGSINEQKFSQARYFVGDGKAFTMSMELKGGDPDGNLVKKEIMVKKLIRCSFCGTNVKQTAKFCHECGAGVQIV